MYILFIIINIIKLLLLLLLLIVFPAPTLAIVTKCPLLDLTLNSLHLPEDL